MILGMLLADRYRIENLLGRGGMGTVWRATDQQSGRPVVVKSVAREIAAFPLAVTRFLREMRVHTLVRSPHVVEVLDRGVDAELGPYLVMEELDGEDLDRRIQRLGPLSLSELMPVAQQVGRALEAIHEQKFVHRDVKPSNVFVTGGAGLPMKAKLLDFGAVKADVPLRGNGERTNPGMLVGTLARMSPEQLQGEPVDERTDIWAFALLVSEALVGAPVIDPELSMGQIVMRICAGVLPSPTVADPCLPPALDAWFAKSTHKHPGCRFASVREQVDALLSIGREQAQTHTVACPAPPTASIRAERNPRVVELNAPVRASAEVVCLVPSTPPHARHTLPAPARMTMPVQRRTPRAEVAGPALASALGATLRPPATWPSGR